MQHPAHLLNLADGRILLSYGQRGKHPHFKGIGYRLSADGGHTWSEPAILLESLHPANLPYPHSVPPTVLHSNGGYPSCVQIEDGRMVTAWYSSTAPGVHERYHMGSGIWTIPTES